MTMCVHSRTSAPPAHRSHHKHHHHRLCCMQPDLAQLQLDEKLAAVFGTKQLFAAALPQEVGKLLQPLEPVTVTHTIQ